MIGFQYGTHHLEPYRKFRSTQEGLANITCCPVEKKNISADNTSASGPSRLPKAALTVWSIDMEMYHSDKSGYHGSCVCNRCFATYLQKYAMNAKQTYRTTSAESRAQWLQDQKRKRSLRQLCCQDELKRCTTPSDANVKRSTRPFSLGSLRCYITCQVSNVDLGLLRYLAWFFQNMSTTMGHTAARSSARRIFAKNLPALFVSGAYVTVQTPAEMATNVVQSSLYTDGWWPWYGTSLLTNMSADKSNGGEYSRVKETSARDYLDRIAAAHTKLDQLLAAPKKPVARSSGR